MSMNAQTDILTSPLVWHPRTVVEAWQLRQTYGMDAVYVSGGTLLRTQWESGVAAMPKHFIDLSAIRGLNEIKIGETALMIGGQVTLQACRRNTILQRHFPMVTEAIRTIAAPSIRHLATIGGNVSSKIGDSMPALLGYDAEVIWYNGVVEQTKLSEYLLQSNISGLGNERLLLSILLPFKEMQEEAAGHAGKELNDIMKIKRFVAYHKVGRREAFTPSVVTAAINGTLADSSELSEIRIALGGGQMIPQRLESLEKEIIGASVDKHLLQHVYDHILQSYEPIEDLFATAAYRKTTAANLVVAELWQAARAK